MQQHVIDISNNITTKTELESTTGENYPNVDTLLETLGNNSLRGGRVGKLLHCPGRKEKLNHVIERETDILTCTHNERQKQLGHFSGNDDFRYLRICSILFASSVNSLIPPAPNSMFPGAVVCAVEEIEKSPFWGEGGKMWPKRSKTNFTTKCLTEHFCRPLQVPNSVWQNFVSCSFASLVGRKNISTKTKLPLPPYPHTSFFKPEIFGSKERKTLFFVQNYTIFFNNSKSHWRNRPNTITETVAKYAKH